jgi:lysophospholipid acyltransferase (LPLAT)-like uncharacterized protein
VKSPLLLDAAERLGPPLLRLLGSSWNVRILPRGEEERRRAEGGRVIFAFWHGRLLVPAFTHRFKNIVIMISQHRDGETIARVVDRLGFRTVRGSTTRGGRAGLAALLREARAGRDLAFAVDGPRGPRYEVQRGVIFAGSRSGLPIIPAAVEADRAWKASSWDRFRVPKPFARVVILQGDPVHLPPDLAGATLEAERKALQDRLHELTRRARRLLLKPAPPPSCMEG